MLHRDWPVPQIEDYIRGLPIWQGTPRLEPLVGGLQNRNYVVTDGAGKYVARVAGELLDIWGVPTSINSAMRAASEIGVSPKLRYSETYLSIIDFIEGKNLAAEELRDLKTVETIVGMIRRIQTEGSPLAHHPISYFNPFDACRHAAWIANERGSKRMDEIGPLIEVVGKLETHFGLFKPVLCHCDMAYVNVMRDTAGKLWIIDWDLCGFGPPQWDIAEMCAYAQVPDEIDRHTVRCYFGALKAADFEQHLFEHRALKMTSYIRIAILCWVLEAAGGSLASEEVAASMAENFADWGSGYDDFARAEIAGFDTVWKAYGNQY